MSQPETVEEQEVRDLITGAGPRPAVPGDEVARIKAAAREEWREMVESERRRPGGRLRGVAALAAGVLLAVAVGWWWYAGGGPVPAAVVASVDLVAGTVTGDAVALAPGRKLSAGTSIQTAGWTEGLPSGAALRLAGGQSLRLAADTRVRLASDRRLELEQGTLYVDSGGAAAAAGVEIVTALGVVRDIGTQFEVRLGQSAAAVRVRVREGEVSLQSEGDSYQVVRGEQLSLMGNGSIVRAGIEPYGPEWDWVLATAPRIEIEGLPLSSFLAWAGREIGREVRYADPALSEAATTTIVHGSIAGFTPTEALASVVAASGFRHEVENGTIVITR